jgi:hypothetical protein
MLIRKNLTGIKSKVRHGLLALTLLVSFFSISGYINSNRPIAKATDTEVLAVKPFALKNGIGYKRASVAFYRAAFVPLDHKQSFGPRILLYDNLVAHKYRHLRLLFLNHKSAANFQIIPPTSYPADQDHLSVG